ncbi:MAG TPA: sugar ABC transporter permease, partial [bacterium]|nr:sugar ABC transporter permease [bacterium]
MESAIVAQPRPSRLRFALDQQAVLGPAFLAPAIIYIVLLVGVPFILALYYSVSAYNIATLDLSFVGLRNYINIMESQVFRQTLLNTFIFTIASNLFALV